MMPPVMSLRTIGFFALTERYAAGYASSRHAAVTITPVSRVFSNTLRYSGSVNILT